MLAGSPTCIKKLLKVFTDVPGVNRALLGVREWWNGLLNAGDHPMIWCPHYNGPRPGCAPIFGVSFFR